MNIPVIVAARLGFGRDIWGITPHNITESLKWLYVAYFMYMLAECLCQLSILAFYLRIMVERKLRQIVWVFIGIVTCFGIANVFSMIFQCTPTGVFFWDGWRGEMAGHCGVDVRLFGFVRGAVEIFLDLVILTLPLPMLAKLNMSPKKKIQIMSMFSVGFVITVVSCLRLWSFVQFAVTQNPTCKYRSFHSHINLLTLFLKMIIPPGCIGVPQNPTSSLLWPACRPCTQSSTNSCDAFAMPAPMRAKVSMEKATAKAHTCVIIRTNARIPCPSEQSKSRPMSTFSVLNGRAQMSSLSRNCLVYDGNI
jgi:uncharacterized membrane protein